VAALVFSDGSTVFFDGVKDMMKYYFNMPNTSPAKTAADNPCDPCHRLLPLEPIDGRQAFYVAGSDVYGPDGQGADPL